MRGAVNRTTALCRDFFLDESGNFGDLVNTAEFRPHLTTTASPNQRFHTLT